MSRLFCTAQYPNSWVVETTEGRWFRFPANLDRWASRQPAIGIDTVRLREIQMERAFNTGLPGTEYTPAGIASLQHLQEHPPVVEVAAVPSRLRNPSRRGHGMHQ